MASLNDFIEAYESALDCGPVKLSAYLPPPAHPLYRDVLRELVRVDMEHSWRRGRPIGLDDYLAAFPTLNQLADVQDLAFEEYRLRLQAGQSPAPAEYRVRYQVDPDSWPRLYTPAPAPRQAQSTVSSPLAGARPLDSSWDLLERLLKLMNSCENDNEQIRLTLQAVRDSLDADCVFHWDASESASRIEAASRVDLAPMWRQEFVRRVLDNHGSGNGKLLLPPLSLPAASREPKVTSAALVRLGSSSSTWLVALSVGPRQFGELDLKVMALARRMLLNQRRHLDTYVQLKDALFSLIQCLTATIDARDPYTCGHSERVARIAVRLGRQMGLPARVQSDLYLAGLLHDIGKIGIRDQVLLKKGTLTADEFAHIRQHTVIGDRILAMVKQLASLRPGVRGHHERFDGKGYPDGLAGQSIPLLARILAVADACDAMMASRPYRQAMPVEQIDRIMAEGAGSQWDPEIVVHFLACRQELYAICQRGLGHSVLHAVENVLQTDSGLSSCAMTLPEGAEPIAG